MTAIAARTSSDAPDPGVTQVVGMLEAMRTRGAYQGARWFEPGIELGEARHAWESPTSGVALRRGALALVADAALYYRDDLCRAIAQRGVAVESNSAAELILSAYDAFGDACVQYLEGDYAFILWDQRSHRVFAARDFVGHRTLFYSDRGDGVVLASSIGGVLADERVSGALNLAMVATTAAGLWNHATETCYEGVSELRAGHTLTWERGSRVSINQFWRPPQALDEHAGSTDDAAEQLRALLTRATEERLAPDAPTAVSLSGGWDSSAVYGAGQNALRGAPPSPRVLRAVSVSYPEGDPGREDEFIAETVAHWQTSTSWLNADDASMFGSARDRARAREEPFAHPYEEWNRALVRKAREAGAHIMLGGSGGDQLFQVSPIFLADLLKRGRWVELFRQWRTQGGGVRPFLKWAVKPTLTDRTLRLLARVRRTGPPTHYLDRPISGWCRPGFLREHRVLELELGARPPLPQSSTVLGETHAFLLYPYFPRITGRVFAFALEEGVEMRSPLLDARVVDFAVRRPWYERAYDRETKILLRRSMRGLLPDRLLAPRPYRTGLTSGYFKRSMQGPGRPLIEEMMHNSRLVDLGIVNPEALKRFWEYYLASGDEEVGVRIFFTTQTELWLRTREARG